MGSEVAAMILVSFEEGMLSGNDVMISRHEQLSKRAIFCDVFIFI